MQTNLYGNRKGLNKLNAANLATNGEYVFARPISSSKTVDGHFKIEYVIKQTPVYNKLEGTVSSNEGIVSTLEPVIDKEIVKELVSITNAYTPWYKRFYNLFK